MAVSLDGAEHIAAEVAMATGIAQTYLLSRDR